MNTTTAAIVLVVVLVAALAAVHVPAGDYMARVYSSDRHLRVERGVYRLVGVDPERGQTWGVYARSVLAFSAVSVLFLYLFQRLQAHLPLSLGFPGVRPALAFNTAVSFVTNTNRQAYSGESTMGHLVQMAGLAVQNFTSAAVGMAVAIALVRGFAARRGDQQLGNFWVDLTRTCVRILLPVALVGAVVFVAAGMVQNFSAGTAVDTLAGGRHVGSALTGQAFTDAQGDPIPKYFQSRPSAAGDGYDPTSTSASNLGPEDTVDTPDDPSLLSQVCARSLAVGKLEGVDGFRPYCTAGGVGAVPAVFHSGPGYAGAVTGAVSVNEYCGSTPAPFLTTYQGVPVRCHRPGEDVTRGQLVPIRGDAPARPAVPADAVTASASGLDPDISPAYAALQVPRVAAVRDLPVDRVRQLVRDHTDGRALGFLGEPGVNVLQLNLDLDRIAPVRP